MLVLKQKKDEFIRVTTPSGEIIDIYQGERGVHCIAFDAVIDISIVRCRKQTRHIPEHKPASRRIVDKVRGYPGNQLSARRTDTSKFESLNYRPPRSVTEGQIV